MTPAETRQAELKELHAPGKPTRLKVIGSNFNELINGQRKQFKEGDVFEHPAPARVKQLLEIQPPIVKITTESTEKEKASAKAEEETAVDMVMQEMREKAKKIVLDRSAKLDKFKKAIEKMTPEVLKAEAVKRGIKDPPVNPDDLVRVLLDDEAEQLKKAV